VRTNELNLEAAMRRLIRSNLVIAGGVTLLALFASIGAFAAPGVTPWPDPFEASGEPGDTDTPGATLEELPEDGDIDTQGDVEGQVDGGWGVPTDSPACAGTVATPNPHDTDGDGDGCREVDTKNLPDPAADAHEGNPGLIGQGHDGDDCGLGPPDGRPRDGRPDGDPPYGPPTDVPLGPRSEPCITPTPTPTP